MQRYIEHLIEAIEDFDTHKNLNNLDSINKVIQEYTNISYLKSLGAFFTEQSLATQAISKFANTITTSSIILDPTCGVGNLLIEASRKLDISKHLSITLKQWGKTLWGYDINPEFIEITKLRLVIEALSRGNIVDCSTERALSFFPNIRVKDAISVTNTQIKKVTHLLINPPFIQIKPPETYYWAKGKVNSAGVFLDHYLRTLPKGCEIVAILPDILRSGSRYHSFRNFVSSQLLGNCQIAGRFSKTADIDVFILFGKLSCTTNTIQWIVSTTTTGSILSDKYNIITGPLVAYRDKQEGKIYPYFHSKNCKNWSFITKATEHRAFNGKVIQPPCILIKRTSSPSDKYRAAAVLINLQQPIAVENHLIVVTAKDHTLESCQKLLKILMQDKTNIFLNQQIRARHLTVGAVKSIPLE